MVTVREAATHDLEAISVLAELLDTAGHRDFPSVVMPPAVPARSATWLEGALSATNTRVLVAEDGAGRVIGFARAHIGPTPDSTVLKQQTVGWMHELAMEPGTTAVETGSALLNAIDSWLKSEGISQVRATVWPSFHEEVTTAFEEHGYCVMSHNLLRDLNT